MISREELVKCMETIHPHEEAVKKANEIFEEIDFNNDGSISEIEHDIKKRPRRQDWDGVLAENGSIYIISKENLLKGQCRLYGRIGTYIMPDSSYYEIDEDIDWIIIEKLLKNKK